MHRFALALLLLPSVCLAQPSGEICRSTMYAAGNANQGFFAAGESLAYEADALATSEYFGSWFLLSVQVLENQWYGQLDGDAHQEWVPAGQQVELWADTRNSGAMTTPNPCEIMNYWPLARLRYHDGYDWVLVEYHYNMFWQVDPY